jgi:hypothetical protein
MECADPFTDHIPPLPAALGRRGQPGLLYREGRAGTARAYAPKRRSASTLTKLACLVAVALQEVERGSLPQFEIGHSRFL